MVQATADSGGASATNQTRRVGPLVALACCTIAGVLGGAYVSYAGGWLIAAAIPLLMMLAMAWRRRPRGVRVWGCFAWIALMAAWTVCAQQYLPADHIARYIQSKPQLATITGVIDNPGRQTSGRGGAFVQFSRRSPSTLAVLRVTAAQVHGTDQPASGLLLLKIPQVEPRLAAGLRIRATGWLEGIDGPSNPGEVDYRKVLAGQGISGRFILDNRDNWQLFEPVAKGRTLENALDGTRTHIQVLREHISARASDSLRLDMVRPDDGTAGPATTAPAPAPAPGIAPATAPSNANFDSGESAEVSPAVAWQERRADFLDALLLGRRGEDLGDITVAFRRSGLIHLLSISGAHMGILLGVVWILARLITGRPRRAALTVLAVLLIYLAVLPMQVPIVRSGIMAGMLGLGYLLNRQMRTIDLVALAAVVVLLWRPEELLTPGFQLSFGVTAGLLLFTRPLRDRLRPAPLITQKPWSRRQSALRWAAGLLAADLVGFAVSLPVVAYHFGWVSPVSLLLSILALPLVTLTLTLGYLKIVLGLVLPSAGLLLARPLALSTDAMIGLVAWVSSWPGTSLQLHHSPSLLWTFTTLALVLALLAGWLKGQRTAALFAVMFCAAWLLVGDRVSTLPPGHGAGVPAVLRLDMVAVGNGSCYLVRVGADDFWRGPAQVLMFDCGSQPYPDVGNHAVLPALRQLGVDRIDTLVISHPDLDHLCGSLDVAEHLPIGRVLVSPQFLNHANAHPGSAAAFLLRGLRAHGARVEAVSRGWSAQWDARIAGLAKVDGRAPPSGMVAAEVLWPPAHFTPSKPTDTNDASIVLSLRAAGRRVLLNGDIQGEAMAGLLAGGADLRADVTDLPHHGSFVDPSSRWLAAVRPGIVLQSAGPSRLEPWNDRWAELLKTRGIDRLVTAQRGMVELTVGRDGAIERWSFKGDTMEPK